MRTQLTKTDRLFLILAIVGLFIFVFSYPTLFPEASLKIEVQKEEIIEIGTDFVENLGYDLTPYQFSIQLEYDQNQDQLQYLNQSFSPSEASHIMADSISIFYWFLRWQTVDSLPVQSMQGRQENLPGPRSPGSIQLFIDLKGKPVAFESQLREDMEDLQNEIVGIEETDYQEAERLYNQLTQLYGGEWIFEESQEINNPFGVIHQYRWHRVVNIANERVVLEIHVQDGRILRFQKVLVTPEPFVREQLDNQWSDIAVFILFFLLFILVMYYFIQRLRADLIDLKTGLIPGVIVFVGWIVYLWAQTASSPPESIWMIVVAFIITAPFIGGGIWILFAVGESLTREVWPDKLLAIDGLRRKLLSPVLGISLFRGIFLAGIGLGLIAILDYTGIILLKGYFTLGDSTFYLWTWSWPSLYAVSNSVSNSLYIVTTFCLFFVTLVKKRFHHPFWIFFITVLLWSFVSFPITQLNPPMLRMLIRGLIGLLFILFFIRYDFMTVATGAVVLPILYYGIAILRTGNGSLIFHGLILIGLIGIILLFAYLAYRSEEPSGEIAPYVPDYLRRIYERERIQRELEIARQVQLSFLPRSNPQIKGLDIAAFCLPTKEVGGDYYDFIDMGCGKLGVAIGDVSGKGISAAFYMTLVKGFLRSQARSLDSPRRILINMNELFYENAERGVFISMIYGVFDLNVRKLTFARAGHNPMILRRSGKGSAEEINPPGIALGLERGRIFPKSIEERRINLVKNDVIFFYTDGLNEAQNRLHEEFREDRLMRVVESYSELSSEELLNKMQQEIRLFTADAPQHDDMTGVIVKIL